MPKKLKAQEKYLRTKKGQEAQKKAVKEYKSKNFRTITINIELHNRIKTIKDKLECNWSNAIESMTSTESKAIEGSN